MKDKYNPDNLFMKGAIEATKEGDRLIIKGTWDGQTSCPNPHEREDVWIEIAPNQLIREEELKKRTEPW